MKSVLVQLTDHDRARARKWSDEVLRNLPRRANYTGLEATDRYYVGYLGELGIMHWLDQHRAIYLHKVRTDGRSQGSEIMVDVQGQTVELEVKAASTEKRRDYLQPESQSTAAAYYSGVRLHDVDAAAEIMGWMTQRQLLSIPVEQGPYCMHRITPYSALECMEDFAKLLYPTMAKASFEAWQARVNPSRELPDSLF